MKSSYSKTGGTSSEPRQSEISKIAGSVVRSLIQGAEQPVSIVVAVTSAHLGEGVSTVSTLMAREMATALGKRTLLLESADIDVLAADEHYAAERYWSLDAVSKFWRFEALGSDTEPSVEWQTVPSILKKTLAPIREQFDVILIDCLPILDFDDVAKLAPGVDGVVLVVQADRAVSGDIQTALHVIESAGTKLIGFVLNRRKYPIPEPIHRLLRKS